MQLRYALLAETIETRGDGKLNLGGAGLETIGTPQFPAVYPGLVVVCRFDFSPIECGEAHRFRVHLLGPDGQELASLDEALRPEPRLHAPYRPVALSVLAGITDVLFPAPGDYAFHLVVDRLEVGVVPLAVRCSTPAAVRTVQEGRPAWEHPRA